MLITTNRPLLAAGCVLVALVSPSASHAGEPEAVRTVHAEVQMRPGAEVEITDVPIYASPYDVKNLDPVAAGIEDDDLVLGVVADGQAVAFPVRFLSSYEVVNARVGKLPVAPSW